MSAAADTTGWTRLRAVLNWVNLSTPLGLLVARLGGATPERGPRGTRLAGGWRWSSFPRADAFTLGNVIICAHDAAWLRARPRLLRHEERHCSQFAVLVGPFMLVPYLLGVVASWVVAGDRSSWNPLERLAGLDDGGYPPPTTRLRSRRR